MKLAPRKPDWDLKRDVAKKLEKLERRTQRAIAELIRMLMSVCYHSPDHHLNHTVVRQTHTIAIVCLSVCLSVCHSGEA